MMRGVPFGAYGRWCGGGANDDDDNDQHQTNTRHLKLMLLPRIIG